VFLAICVIAGVVQKVAKSMARHRERMAMIEQGMHPDDPAATVDQEDA
jgi:hypothetical protein